MTNLHPIHLWRKPNHFTFAGVRQSIVTEAVLRVACAAREEDRREGDVLAGANDLGRLERVNLREVWRSDLTGERYARLVVVKTLNAFRCVCDCGKRKKMSKWALKKG